VQRKYLKYSRIGGATRASKFIISIRKKYQNFLNLHILRYFDEKMQARNLGFRVRVRVRVMVGLLEYGRESKGRTQRKETAID
jgi:hypothetical protein